MGLMEKLIAALGSESVTGAISMGITRRNGANESTLS